MGYPPPDRTTGVLGVHEVHGGPYASCVHAGGLSCWFLKSKPELFIAKVIIKQGDDTGFVSLIHFHCISLYFKYVLHFHVKDRYVKKVKLSVHQSLVDF